MNAIKVLLEYSKQTKNTIKYVAESELAPVEALYINKRDMLEALKPNKEYPANLEIVISKVGI